MSDLALIDFLEQLRLQDIHLRVEGGELRCSVLPGSLSPEIGAAIVERKPQIISFLTTGRCSTSTLVKIKPGGHKPPLYVLPAHDVNVYDWVSVAHFFDPDRPLLALEPPLPDGSSNAWVTVEELATLLIRDLRAHQPHGPYHLAGYCSGGMVAYEIAQQLLSQGETVGLLGLFETPSPRAYGRWGRAMVWLKVRRWRMKCHLQRLAPMAPRQRLEYVRAAFQRLALSLQHKWRWLRQSWSNFRRPPPAPLEETPRVHLDCVESYQPRPYAGRLHFFFTNSTSLHEKFSRQQDWLQLARQGAVCLVGPEHCWHYEMLLSPFAPHFARLLAESLDQADASP